MKDSGQGLAISDSQIPRRERPFGGAVLATFDGVAARDRRFS
jgi:hypothetical protein